MPIYGYHCTQCEHEFEILQSMSAPPLTACPKCGGPLRKLLYPVGVQFKGSGFYSTDYKTNGSGSSTSSNGSKKDSESKSDSKSESKTEVKPDTKASGSSSSDPKGD
jgi:putative FmdB family regulatory protein